MISQVRWLAVLLLLTAFASDASADVAPCLTGWGRRNRDLSVPKIPTEDAIFDFEIIRDPNAQEAELRIPRRMLVAEVGKGNSTRTAMAGLALSTAIVTGGLWCVCFRGKTIPRKKLLGAAALVILLVGSVVLANLAEANVPPPHQIFEPTVQLGEANIQVRIVEQGDAVQLVAPPALADKIAAR